MNEGILAAQDPLREESRLRAVVLHGEVCSESPARCSERRGFER